MTEPHLKLLALSDLHYSSAQESSPAHPRRQSGWGRELLRRAIEDARNRGGFDAIAILGDLIDDAAAPCAAGDLAGLKEELTKAAGGVPVIVIPGNHDQGESVAEAFATTCQPIACGGYRILPIIDQYAAGDLCIRGQASRDRLAQLAAAGGGPIVVLQHNPMNPAIVSDYPYMLCNRAEVMADYQAHRVLLSISGHYHAGQELSDVGGVKYLTLPALCEEPFRYALVELAGRAVRTELRGLKLDDRVEVIDCHAHTEFAYCGRGISAEQIIRRAVKFGVSTVCLVEHAPQLYCSAEDFWHGLHITRPELWRTGPDARMAQFRREILPLRRPAAQRGLAPALSAGACPRCAPHVAGHAGNAPASSAGACPRCADLQILAGLEVELDCEGQITVRQEDRDWPDLLVGAVHFLRKDHRELDDAAMGELFLATCGGLIDGGCDVLAHPWRVFQRAGRRVPTELYPVLAQTLATAGVAAEINLHINHNDVAFLRECLSRGVRIALGSDAHELYEAGAFTAHLSILHQAAAPAGPAAESPASHAAESTADPAAGPAAASAPANLAGLLWRPGQPRRKGPGLGL